YILECREKRRSLGSIQPGFLASSARVLDQRDCFSLHGRDRYGLSWDGVFTSRRTSVLCDQTVLARKRDCDPNCEGRSERTMDASWGDLRWFGGCGWNADFSRWGERGNRNRAQSPL